MSLLRRGSIYWTYFYLDGVRHQESTGTSNRRLAEQIAEKLKQEAIAHKYQLVLAKPDLTFGGLSATFIAEGGATAYHLGRLKLLLPFFSEIKVERISKGLAGEYRIWRMKQKKVSDATLNRDLSVLRHILYWAVDNSLLLANPLARMKMARERRTKKRVLNVSEEEALLKGCSDYFRPIVVLALDTGMRRGEILHQVIEDIDFERRLLSVTHSKTPEGESREIPLTSRVYDLLVSKRDRYGLVFTYHEKPIHLIKTAWKRSIERSGIRRLRFHDLRHSFNTRLMEAGVVQDVRKALMGHSSGTDVHSAYTHVELPAKRQALVKLETWIEAQKRDIANRDSHPVNNGGSTDGQTAARFSEEGDLGTSTGRGVGSHPTVQ